MKSIIKIISIMLLAIQLHGQISLSDIEGAINKYDVLVGVDTFIYDVDTTFIPVYRSFQFRNDSLCFVDDNCIVHIPGLGLELYYLSYDTTKYQFEINGVIDGAVFFDSIPFRPQMDEVNLNALPLVIFSDEEHKPWQVPYSLPKAIRIDNHIEVDSIDEITRRGYVSWLNDFGLPTVHDSFDIVFDYITAINNSDAVDNDKDSINEIQTLSVVDEQLVISDGNAVDLEEWSLVNYWALSGNSLYRIGSNIGINLTNPTAKLEILTDDDLSTNDALKIDNTSGEIFSLTNEGSIGIGVDPVSGLSITTDENMRIGSADLGQKGTSVFLGENAMASSTNTTRHAAFGTDALRFSGADATNNVAFGYHSMRNSNGIANVGIGVESAKSIGDYNVAIGYLAQQTGSPTYSTAIGYLAGRNNTGNSCVLIGRQSGNSNTGAANVGIGIETVKNCDGNYNVAIGQDAMKDADGSDNVAIGRSAGRDILLGDNNVFVGSQSGENNEGAGNVFIGHESGRNETGSNFLYIDNSNTASPLIHGDFSTDALTVNGTLGYTTQGGTGVSLVALDGSGNFTTTESNDLVTALNHWTKIASDLYYNSGNVGIGTGSPVVKLDVRGRINALDALSNTFVGNQAGNETLSGTGNLGFGSGPLRNLTTGTNNIANGENAMFNTTTGSNSIAIGPYAGYNSNPSYAIHIGNNSGYNDTSTGSISMGRQALNSHTTGNYNIALGQWSLRYHTSGHGNVAIGYKAGEDNLTGTANVFLGYLAGSGGETGSNKLYIENSNSTTPLIYGDFSTDEIFINGDLGYSDEGGTAISLIGKDSNGKFTTTGTSSLVSDDQQLSIDSSGRVFTISLEDGGSVDFEDTVDDADADDQNEGDMSWDFPSAGNYRYNSNTPTSQPLIFSDVLNTSGYTFNQSGNSIGINGPVNTDNQTLSFTTPNLSISGGNSVDLSPLQDGTGTDDQNISGSGLSGTVLTIGIENGTNEDVDLEPIATPLTIGTQGRVYYTSGLSLPYFGIQTTSPTHELHVNGQFRIENGTIIDTNNSGGSNGQVLSRDAGGVVWANDDDNQTLSYSNGDLTISGGNTVDISDVVEDAIIVGKIERPSTLSTITVSASSSSLINFTSSTLNGFTTVGDTDELIIPSTGQYEFNFYTDIISNGTTDVNVVITIDGVAQSQHSAKVEYDANNDRETVHYSGMESFTLNDEIGVQITVGSGASIDYDGSHLIMKKLY